MRAHSHHNTTHETGETAARFEAAAGSQEELVLAFFRRRRRPEGWTPSEVNRQVMPDCPLTSTRRAITNLTHDGRLIRTNTKRRGPYGRPEFAWDLIMEPEQAALF